MQFSRTLQFTHKPVRPSSSSTGSNNPIIMVDTCTDLEVKPMGETDDVIVEDEDDLSSPVRKLAFGNEPPYIEEIGLIEGLFARLTSTLFGVVTLAIIVVCMLIFILYALAKWSDGIKSEDEE